MLTQETLRTPLKPGSYIARVSEDITYMDTQQLEKFIIGLVIPEMRKGLLPFLPVHFWVTPRVAHPQIDFRAGHYFAGIVYNIEEAREGTFTDSDGSALDFDPTYPSKLEHVLSSIANECLNPKVQIDQPRRILAKMVVDAAEYLPANTTINKAAQSILNDVRYFMIRG